MSDIILRKKISNIQLIKEILKSRILRMLFSLHSQSNLKQFESQKKLLIDLLNSEKFIIIILDACRPESLHKWLSHNKPSLLKYLTKVRSEGKTTKSWFIKTFKDYQFDLTYISGNPYINSTGITPVGKIARNCFTEIVDAWREWSENEQTCTPQTMNKFALINLNKPRLIVHYLQPHQPYIGDIRIPEYMQFISNWNEMKLRHLQRLEMGFDPPKILQVFSSRIFNEDEKNIIRQAYESNVNLVCSHAFQLIDKIKEGTIIITSDHSEMMGENGCWFHYQGHPKLHIVPWLKISKS